MTDKCACAFLSAFAYDKTGCSAPNYTPDCRFAWKWRSVHEPMSDWLRFSCPGTDAQSLFCFRESDKTAFLVFRGSESWKDLLADVSVFKRRPKFLQDSECKVHAGFLNQFKACSDKVVEYLARHPDRSRTIVTGHSLGGAIAMICSVFVARGSGEKPVQCVTFGSPRVGDRAFAALAESVATITRVVVGYDPVSNLPSRARWKHAGARMWYVNGVAVRQRFGTDPPINLLAVPNLLRVRDHDTSGYIDCVASEAADASPVPWWRAEVHGLYLAALIAVGAVCARPP